MHHDLVWNGPQTVIAMCCNLHFAHCNIFHRSLLEPSAIMKNIPVDTFTKCVYTDRVVQTNVQQEQRHLPKIKLPICPSCPSPPAREPRARTAAVTLPRPTLQSSCACAYTGTLTAATATMNGMTATFRITRPTTERKLERPTRPTR